MAIYSAGFKTAAAAAATFSGASAAYLGIWAGSVLAHLLQLEILNTTATDCEVSILKYTTRGTQSTTQVGNALNKSSIAAITTVDTAWSVNPTIGAATTILKRAWLPAAKGGGIIWVWPPDQFPVGQTEGLAVINPLGTGQVLEINATWAE